MNHCNHAINLKNFKHLLRLGRNPLVHWPCDQKLQLFQWQKGILGFVSADEWFLKFYDYTRLIPFSFPQLISLKGLFSWFTACESVVIGSQYKNTLALVFQNTVFWLFSFSLIMRYALCNFIDRCLPSHEFIQGLNWEWIWWKNKNSCVGEGKYSCHFCVNTSECWSLVSVLTRWTKKIQSKWSLGLNMIGSLVMFYVCTIFGLGILTSSFPLPLHPTCCFLGYLVAIQVR